MEDFKFEPEEQHTLTNGQVLTLLRMTEALNKPWIMEAAQVIKSRIEGVEQLKQEYSVGFMEEAKEAWQELTEDEQTSLWVAPKFGGIFTTKEREIIQNGFKGE